MNDPIYVDFTDGPEAEVELSAQDLLDIPPAAPVVATATSAPPIRSEVSEKPAVPEKKVAPVAPKNVPAAAVQTARWLTVPRAAWSMGLVIAAGVVVAANQMYSAPQVTQPVPMIVSSIPQAPDPIPVEEALPPTLATNPFDPSEVFELAPGLSKEEARAAVEALLLERAAQRQVASIGAGGGVRGR